MVRIGFIGAGKAGFSLGKYFASKDCDVAGYFSRNFSSAKEAADFTGTKAFDTMKQLVEVSDALFITVPDGAIASVWDMIRCFSLNGKYICHLSGAMDSHVFSDISEAGAFGYSVHPFLAISDKYTSYKLFDEAFFTVEGDKEHIEDVCGFISSLGNRVQTIDALQKVRYHMAASIASNFMVSLYDVSQRLLFECGFCEENLPYALKNLVTNNIDRVIQKGPEEALTGPVERGDYPTVKKHLELCDDDLKGLYIPLAKATLSLAKRKNPDRDYTKLGELLSEKT